MIIGISGKIGCGKSTLTQHLMMYLAGYKRIAFGDLLKQETANAFNFPLDLCYSQEGKLTRFRISRLYENVVRAQGPILGAAFYKAFANPDKLGRNRAPKVSVRELLQFYGGNRVQVADKNYWVGAVANALSDLYAPPQEPMAIIDDVRFPNEANFVKDNDGILIRIEPYDVWEPGPYAQHISETALDDYAQWALVTGNFQQWLSGCTKK